MGLKSAFRELFGTDSSPEAAQTDRRNEIRDSFLGSKRFLVVLGLLIGLFYFPTLVNSWPLAAIVVAYILGESYTKGKVIDANRQIKHKEVETDVEYEKLAKRP